MLGGSPSPFPHSIYDQPGYGYLPSYPQATPVRPAPRPVTPAAPQQVRVPGPDELGVRLPEQAVVPPPNQLGIELK